MAFFYFQNTLKIPVIYGTFELTQKWISWYKY
jgi:hypothetical protein